MTEIICYSYSIELNVFLDSIFDSIFDSILIPSQLTWSSLKDAVLRPRGQSVRKIIHSNLAISGLTSRQIIPSRLIFSL